MLTWGDLMVGIFHADAPFFQLDDGVSPQLDGGVACRQVEVAALVEELGAVAVFKIKILQFRANIVGIAQVGSFLQVPLQY